MSSEISKVEAQNSCQVLLHAFFSGGLMGEDNDKTMLNQPAALSVSQAGEHVSGPRFFYVYRYNIPLAFSEPDTEMSLQLYSLTLSAFSFIHLGQQLPTSSSPLSQSLLPALVSCD